MIVDIIKPITLPVSRNCDLPREQRFPALRNRSLLQYKDGGRFPRGMYKMRLGRREEKS